MSHIRLARECGSRRFPTLPTGLREGLADDVALGPPDASRRNRVLTDSPVTPADMRDALHFD